MLIDGRSGETLAAQAPARRLPIASATKLMTARIALQRLPLRRRVRMAPYSALSVESVLGISAGTAISVRDLIYALILQSANDAAHTLAEVIGGSQAGFVSQMNRSAAALGLVNTHYTNPIGLDAPGNYSSARDLAALARLLLRDRSFARVADSSSATLSSLRPALTIGTRNTLLLREPWVTGVKTGHTLGAGYVEVGSGRRKGVDLVSVVLGAPSEAARDLETLALLDYGHSLYVTRRPVGPGEILARASIRHSGGELPLRSAHPISAALRRGQDVRTSIRAPDEVTGPIPEGKRLGRVTVKVDGREIAAAALVASRSIAEASWLDRARSGTSGVVALIAVAAFAILTLAFLARRRLSGGAPQRLSEEEMRTRRDQRRRIREQQRGAGEEEARR